MDARIAGGLLALVLGLTEGAGAAEDRGVFWFEWSLSRSATDQWANSGSPQMGAQELYLFMSSCAANCVKRIEFSLAGDLEVVSLTPMAGFTNLGTANSPILEHDTCFDGWGQLVATIVVWDEDGQGGSLCFSEAIQTGRNCTATCDTKETLFRHWYRGFSSNGAPPCAGESTTAVCEQIVSVDSYGWGTVKAQYH